VIWLLACQPADEATIYQKALQNNDLQLCQKLSNAKQAECGATVIALMAEEDPNGALQACNQIKEKKWRGECFFLISDNAGLIGDDARAVCALADPFVEDCLRHAAARDVEQSLYPTINDNQPMKVMPRMYQLIREYLSEEIAQPMARDMILRRMGGTITTSFDENSCIGIPKDMCVQLYLVASLGSGRQWTGEEDWWKYCEQKLTVELAVSHGFLPWSSQMEEVTSAAWKQLCQANQAIKPEAN